MKMKVEIGVMLPDAKHTKDWSKHPRAEGGALDRNPQSLGAGRSPALPLIWDTRPQDGVNDFC